MKQPAVVAAALDGGAFQRFPTYPAAITKIRLCSSFSEMFSPKTPSRQTNLSGIAYSRFQLLASINGWGEADHWTEQSRVRSLRYASQNSQQLNMRIGHHSVHPDCFYRKHENKKGTLRSSMFCLLDGSALMVNGRFWTKSSWTSTVFTWNRLKTYTHTYTRKCRDISTNNKNEKTFLIRFKWSEVLIKHYNKKKTHRERTTSAAIWFFHAKRQVQNVYPPYLSHFTFKPPVPTPQTPPRKIR